MKRLLTVSAVSVALSGCGTYVPKIEEAWEPVGLPNSLEFKVKDHIFCQVVKTLRDMRDPETGTFIGPSRLPTIPDDYTVQMQLTLTAEESTNFAPGLSWNKSYRQSTVAGNNIMNMFSVGFGVNASSTSTRTDISYAYYNVGRIIAAGRNKDCDRPKVYTGSSLLLESDLGLRDFLDSESAATRISPSSLTPKDKKDIKADVYSMDIKFVIVSNGNVSPTWKLVNVSADTGSAPLLSTGRTRTHELILTFSPGGDQPINEAVQLHFNEQIVQQLNRLERSQ